ncbi:MAG TPA: hypothetical protein VMJ64_07485, partial [Anaerolineales bacterium]|nr:hypothetical protein [Anaerolineales bacterium]
KNYHDDPTKPPFPWDPEAARWSREYRKNHPNCFPVDNRELMRPERVKLNAGAVASSKPPEVKKPSIKLTSSSPAPAPKPAAKPMVKPAPQPAPQPAAKDKPKPKIRIK